MTRYPVCASEAWILTEPSNERRLLQCIISVGESNEFDTWRQLAKCSALALGEGVPGKTLLTQQTTIEVWSEKSTENAIRQQMARDLNLSFSFGVYNFTPRGPMSIVMHSRMQAPFIDKVTGEDNVNNIANDLQEQNRKILKEVFGTPIQLQHLEQQSLTLADQDVLDHNEANSWLIPSNQALNQQIQEMPTNINSDLKSLPLLSPSGSREFATLSLEDPGHDTDSFNFPLHFDQTADIGIIPEMPLMRQQESTPSINSSISTWNSMVQSRGEEQSGRKSRRPARASRAGPIDASALQNVVNMKVPSPETDEDADNDGKRVKGYQQGRDTAERNDRLQKEIALLSDTNQHLFSGNDIRATNFAAASSTFPSTLTSQQTAPIGTAPITADSRHRSADAMQRLEAIQSLKNQKRETPVSEDDNLFNITDLLHEADLFWAPFEPILSSEKAQIDDQLSKESQIRTRRKGVRQEGYYVGNTQKSFGNSVEAYSVALRESGSSELSKKSVITTQKAISRAKSNATKLSRSGASGSSASRSASSRTCATAGCKELVSGRLKYCAKHSTSKKCRFEGCSKCAQVNLCNGRCPTHKILIPDFACTVCCNQGSTQFCIAHGGGRRCTIKGCSRAARDMLYCAGHGGGRRCESEGCTKGAVGSSKLCTAHGGGRRCQV